MLHFSLILPTRERPQQVYRLFDSIKETTSDLSSIEIILYVDEDDHLSRKISYPSLNIKKIILPRKPMGKVTNICYEASGGSYIMLVNDDVIFRTKGWDERVIKCFEKFNDRIALVYGNDLDYGEKMAVFPFLSREVCELMGKVCPEEFAGNYIDVHLMDIFCKLVKMGHKRIFYLPDVIFEHVTFKTGKAPIDNVYLNRSHKEGEIPFVALDIDRYYLAIKLEQFIKDHSSI